MTCEMFNPIYKSPNKHEFNLLTEEWKISTYILHAALVCGFQDHRRAQYSLKKTKTKPLTLTFIYK